MSYHRHNSHADVINRLKRASGHLNRVIKMIESQEECLKVAQQLHGVCKAVQNAKTVLIHDHIEHCLDHDFQLQFRKTQKSTLMEFKEIAKCL